MKATLIIFALALVSFSLGAQTFSPIKGKVIDKETKEPIVDIVIKYGKTYNDYLFSDEKGNFEIKNEKDSVLTIQGIGYKPVQIKMSDFAANPVINLEPLPISLEPFVINPYLADILLEKAMEGTRKHILVDKPVSYLLHFLQVEDYARDRRNRIYLEYTSTLKNKDLKKNKAKDNLPYTYSLTDIYHYEETTVPLSDLLGAEYHASHLLSFGKSENNVTTMSYSSDTTKILLSIKPDPEKDGWAEGEIIIDKKDMVLLKMEIQSVDSLLEKQPYKKYREKRAKIVRKKGSYEFEKIGDKYYMSACFTLYKFHSLDEFDRKDEFTYTCDVKALEMNDKRKTSRRVLSGYCQELFYIPNTTKRIFWQ